MKKKIKKKKSPSPKTTQTDLENTAAETWLLYMQH